MTDKGTPLNKDNNSKSIDLRSNKSVKNAASAQEMKVCPRKRSSREEDWNISGNIFNWRHYLRNSTLIYNPHLQYDCNSSPGVFKTLLNNSKARRNFRYANLFLTVISSYAAKYFWYTFLKFSFRISGMCGFERCDDHWSCVCLCNSLAIMATFKESSDSLAFWDFGILCQTKPDFLMSIGCGGL